MSQRSRPDGDVYTGGWSPTPLWEQLSEPPPPHDGTFIASPSLPPGRTFTVALDPLAAPIAGVPEDEVRPHELVVRLDGTGCGPRALVVLINTLHGEDRWIKSQLFDLGPGFQSYTLALSYREAARIEDYAALKVLVAASADLCPGEGGSSSSSSSGSLSVSTASSSRSSGASLACSGVNAPLVFHASPTGCGIPSSFPMSGPTIVGGSYTWGWGATAGCADPLSGITFQIICQNGVWTWAYSDGHPPLAGPFTPVSVSPFYAIIHFTPARCCGGTLMTITVTE